MNVFSKSIDGDFFHIVFQDTKEPHRELPEHLHDWHEIIYIYSGKGTVFIDNHFYEVSSGNIFILPANTIHRTVPDAKNPITTTALFFHPSTIIQSAYMSGLTFTRIIDKSKQNRDYRYSIPKIQREHFEKYLLDMKTEYSQYLVDSSEAIILLLHLFLIELNRHCLKEQNVNVGYEPEWLKKCLTYIDTHLGENLDLLMIAKIASVSPAHFSRVFSELIGFNFTDYLTTKRIIWAKKLLSSTDETIHSIANQSGYKSMPHFYRTFKKNTGKTPKEYRLATRNPY